MTEQIKQVADRIKGLREISDVSVENLSNLLSISVNKYMEYESGNIDIPVSFLYQVSQYFDVELSALLSGENPRLHVYCVVRKGKGLSVERRKQYKYENLAFNFINKKAEPFIVTIDPESENFSFQYNSHSGQEFNYVLEGTLMVIIDGHEITLNEGDSIYFDSGYNHAVKALNNKSVRIIAIVL